MAIKPIWQIDKEHDDMRVILNDLVALIETCPRCDGTGFNPHDATSACDRCGGQGKILDATGMISDINNVLKQVKA